MPTFLVAGSIAYDQLLTYDGSFIDGIDTARLEELSIGYVTRRLTRHYGGTAANVAWNLCLLQQEVLIAGSVGRDGEEYLERLKERGVNVSLVRICHDEVTPTAIIGTDTGERQITFYHPGADQRTEAPDLTLLRGQVSMVLVSPHLVLSMVGVAHGCRELGIPYLFDPGQQSLQFGVEELRRIVKGSAGLIVNAYEWSLLSEVLGWNAQELLEHTDLLVVTHGEHGLALQTREESLVLAAVPAPRLLNPTGAGDALRAGLMTGLALGWRLRDAGRLGAALASFVVEVEGTQLESFSLDELSARAESAYGEKLPPLR